MGFLWDRFLAFLGFLIFGVFVGGEDLFFFLVGSFVSFSFLERFVDLVRLFFVGESRFREFVLCLYYIGRSFGWVFVVVGSRVVEVVYIFVEGGGYVVGFEYVEKGVSVSV